LLKSTVVAALGGLLFGFDTAVISGTTAALTQTYQLSAAFGWESRFQRAFWEQSSEPCWRVFPASVSAGANSLRVMAVLYLISGLGCALAWNWHALVVFRFIGGLGVGGSSVLGPMYIAEISPAKLRGRLVGFFPIQRGLRDPRRLFFRITSSACSTWEQSNGGGNSASPPSPPSCSS